MALPQVTPPETVAERQPDGRGASPFILDGKSQHLHRLLQGQDDVAPGIAERTVKVEDDQFDH